VKIQVPDDYIPLITKALDQYYAYIVAVQREDGKYRTAADFFRALEKKGPTREVESGATRQQARPKKRTA
jgi:hypothetical protein